ncbi:MAG TPA: ArsI/CadI family heavy metal resistance metalloenzyme [Pirellulales bacterium]|nr:ArsI/CadI family heavy metal resistance metalloenzyme [Pirellulales bacterium]
MSTLVETAATKAHLSLNVADLGAAVEFYRVLFGVEPAKRYEDYAKFELDSPPVVFSLQPGPKRAGASLSHIGLRFTSPEAVLEIQNRLASAGIPFSRQEGVVCGYARQSKCWVSDPDNNYWEIYVLEADVDPNSIRACLTLLIPTDSPDGPAANWRHRLGDPLPQSIPRENGSVDEMLLDGTVNARGVLDRGAFWSDVRRALRSGGKLKVRGVAANRPQAEAPAEAPGWVNRLECLPMVEDVVTALGQGGLVSLQLTQLSKEPVWQLDELELREFEIVAHAPSNGASELDRRVLYRGPFREAVDFAGNVYRRGERTPVSERTWNELRRGPFAEQFLFAVQGAAGTCGGDNQCAAADAAKT